VEAALRVERKTKNEKRKIVVARGETKRRIRAQGKIVAEGATDFAKRC
jgi:hypothetical protein